MTTVVSFTDFRENLSKYLDFIASGNKVEINDTKKDKKLVTLVAEKEDKFDWEAYMKFIKNFKPVFTDKDLADYEERRKMSRLRMKRNNW